MKNTKSELFKRHFVTFLSPGTLVFEETTKSIDDWDVDLAIKMSKKIVERYEARPFAFFFTTRGRRTDELDSREIKRSGRFYLGGTLKTEQQVKLTMPNNDILLGNMQSNGWDKVVESNTPYKTFQPFKKGDVLLRL